MYGNWKIFLRPPLTISEHAFEIHAWLLIDDVWYYHKKTYHQTEMFLLFFPDFQPPVPIFQTCTLDHVSTRHDFVGWFYGYVFPRFVVFGRIIHFYRGTYGTIKSKFTLHSLCTGRGTRKHCKISMTIITLIIITSHTYMICNAHHELRSERIVGMYLLTTQYIRYKNNK